MLWHCLDGQMSATEVSSHVDLSFGERLCPYAYWREVLLVDDQVEVSAAVLVAERFDPDLLVHLQQRRYGSMDTEAETEDLSFSW